MILKKRIKIKTCQQVDSHVVKLQEKAKRRFIVRLQVHRNCDLNRLRPRPTPPNPREVECGGGDGIT